MGEFPIGYLGLPLSSRKWSKFECQQLIDKITNKIKLTYTKQLSYAGTLQIINSVFFSIYNFCGSVFILPQSVLKEVDRKCREYLWGGSENKRKVSLVVWDKVCCSKKNGGLNIKECRFWNMAAVGKMVWQLVVNKDSLWIKWVHGVYLKNGEDIWNHKVPADSSWYCRKIKGLADKMQNWYIHGRYRLTSTGVYSINRSYMELRNDHPKLANAKLIWTSVAQPKHRFIMWLTIQNRLLTRERLGKLNIPLEESSYCLCDNQVTESADHLFNGCPWFQEVKKGVEQWTGLQLSLGSLRTILQCIKKKKWKKFQREPVAATWGAMVYHT
ncbi:uncharacterized protein LOC142176077 [Nicotiana tabacum]|uniref:Uncharacterized protein LOC142176077 n=1 Tax=Nicotiana tabacum TaxID=4097 RepID=A0AC58TPU3_TOBAC